MKSSISGKISGRHKNGGFCNSPSRLLLAVFIVLTASTGLRSRVFSPETRLLIFDFQPIGVSETESRTVTELISAKIVKHHVFTVVDRTHLDSILKEHELQRSGFTSHEERMKLGRMLNSEKIMHGSVSRMNSLYYVTIKITDVVKGTVEWSDAVKMKDLSLIDEYISLYLQKIVRDEEIGSDMFMKKGKTGLAPSDDPNSGIVKKPDKIMTQEPEAGVGKNRKSSWYIGFGFGGANGRITYMNGEKTTLQKYVQQSAGEHVDYNDGSIIDFGVGFILNQYFHLGFDMMGFGEQAKIKNRPGSNNTGAPRSESLDILNGMALITYYPFSRGLNFRGGIGISTLEHEIVYYNRSGSKKIELDGSAYSAGIGYALTVGITFTVCANLDYTRMNYEKEVRSVDMVSFSISAYWF